MTCDEIIDAALARVAEFSDTVPSAREPMVRRIDHRQAQLFARTAEISPDYTGLAQVVGVSPSGSADLNYLDPSPERVYHVEIEDDGGVGYETGQVVNVISPQEPDAADPPRAVLRSGILAGYNGELDGVATLAVYYARRPNPITSRSSVPELHEGFHELFVLDLCKYNVRKLLGMKPTRRQQLLDLFAEEELEIVGDFERHVERFNQAETSRFGRSARALDRPRPVT